MLNHSLQKRIVSIINGVGMKPKLASGCAGGVSLKSRYCWLLFGNPRVSAQADMMTQLSAPKAGSPCPTFPWIFCPWWRSALNFVSSI